LSDRIRFTNDIAAKQARAKDSWKLYSWQCQSFPAIHTLDTILKYYGRKVARLRASKVLAAYWRNYIDNQIVRKYISVPVLSGNFFCKVAAEVLSEEFDAIADFSYTHVRFFAAFVLSMTLGRCVGSW
jgi:hypothetical protein